MSKKTFGGKIALIAIVGVIAFMLFAGSQIFGTNDFKTYHVKQAFYTGTMSVISDPGTYPKLFGDIEPYDRAGIFYFSNEKLDGGDGADAQPLKATFMGNSTADVSGVLKYRLPSSDSLRLGLHRNFGSGEAIRMELVRNVVAEAIKQTSPMFRPEEAFITKRAEYTRLVNAMLVEGLYDTETYIEKTERNCQIDEKTKKKTGCKIIEEQQTRLKLVNGKPVIVKESPFKTFGINITQFMIKDFDFDSKTNELIRKKKEAEQIQVVARAEAEKAKQDAITETEKGKARIAKAKADKEVEKIQAVTQAQKEKEVAVLQAQKEKEVAELEAQKAKEVAKKIVAEGRAEAEKNRLKVSAGLTPQEREEYRNEREIAIAKVKWEGIAKVKFPQTMVIGSDGQQGKVDPFMAMGLESLQNMTRKK